MPPHRLRRVLAQAVLLSEVMLRTAGYSEQIGVVHGVAHMCALTRPRACHEVSCGVVWFYVVMRGECGSVRFK